jgi:hypothetical protein
MKYGKILPCTTALVCIAFQACTQSDPLGESVSSSTMGSSGDYPSPNMDQVASSANPGEGRAGMAQWLDQPITTLGSEATLDIAGILAVALVALRRRR